MTDTDHPVRLSARNDVLTLPAVMLGFIPSESVVLMHLIANRVEFCCRIDAENLHGSAGWIERQMAAVRAGARRQDGHWLVLLYSDDPSFFAEAASRLGEHSQVSGILATDLRSSWEVCCGELIDERPFDTAAAIRNVQGSMPEERPVAASRQEAVGRIVPWAPNDRWVQEARAVVWEMDPGARVEMLRDFLDLRVAPTGEFRAVLASLLGEDECFVELLARMTAAESAHWRELLLGVRQQSPPEALANVTALLALASWLDGGGVLTTQCLEELDQLHPGHPLGAMIRRMQELAIPPSRWDE